MNQNLDFTIVCSSCSCPRYDNCKKAIAPIGTLHTTINYASYGSGGSDEETTYACGPAGNYKLFEPIQH